MTAKKYFNKGCGITLNAKSSPPKFGFLLSTELDATEQVVKVGGEEIELVIPKITIDITEFSEGCQDIPSWVADVIEFFVNTFSSVVSDFLSDVVSKATTDYVQNEGKFDIPLPFIPANVEIDGRSLAYSPSITSFTASDSPASLGTTAASTFTASLDAPEHHKGRKFTSPVVIGTIPKPIADQLINVLIPANGLNAFFEPAWYLMWSFLATDEAAISSPLCKPIDVEDDSCPFPPLRHQPDFFRSLILTLASLVAFGPMWNWDLEVFADPPRVDFVAGNIITGTALGKVSVRAAPLFGSLFWGSQGQRQLALLDLSASLSAVMPDYDTQTGIFSGLRLSNDVRVADAQVGGFFGFLTEWALRGPLSTAANIAINVSVFNQILDLGLSKIPIKLPDIPFFQITLRTALEDLEKKAVPGEDGGYLEFGSNLGVTIDPPIQSLRAAQGVYETLAYKKAISGDYHPATVFTTMVYENGRYVPIPIRRSESGAIQQLQGSEWAEI